MVTMAVHQLYTGNVVFNIALVLPLSFAVLYTRAHVLCYIYYLEIHYFTELQKYSILYIDK